MNGINIIRGIIPEKWSHRGKVKKTIDQAFPLRMVEEELRSIPTKGWAEMIRKV